MSLHLGTCSPCRDGSKCLSFAKFCDGKFNCRDRSDEDPKVCEGKGYERIYYCMVIINVLVTKYVKVDFLQK